MNIKALVILFSLVVPLQAGVTCRMELDRSVLPVAAKQTAILRISLEGSAQGLSAQRPAVNVAVVLDKSGSMSGKKITHAHAGTIEVLRRLSTRDLFSLVTYSNNVETLIQPGHVRNQGQLEALIRSIKAEGGTALFGGVSQGASELRKNLNPNAIHRVILVSDGQANIGPSSPIELKRLGAALVKEGISVTTLGVGNDYNEDLMTMLSQASDGNTYYAAESEDLPQIFARELGDVLTVVAGSVNLVVTCSDNVKPLRIIGREGRIRGNKVELFLNQIYGDQEKSALLEVEILGGSHDAELPIAHSTISYRDQITQKDASTKQALSARFSSETAIVTASNNYEVTQEYLLNTIAESQDLAVTQADQGYISQAADTLAQSILKTKEAARSNNDPLLAEKARELDEMSKRISAKGLSKKDRKKMRTDSYQTRNQQNEYLHWKDSKQKENQKDLKETTPKKLEDKKNMP